MNYKIREATYNDAEWIAKVHMQSWEETYTWIISKDYLESRNLNMRTKKWKEKLKENEEGVWNFVVETDKGEVIGFASWWTIRKSIEGYTGELYAIYILEKYQWNNLWYLLTQKVGSTLLSNGMSNMIVVVLEDNLSKNFYIKYWAKLLKKVSEKIWEQDLMQEIYWWDDFKSFDM